MKEWYDIFSIFSSFCTEIKTQYEIICENNNAKEYSSKNSSLSSLLKEFSISHTIIIRLDMHNERIDI